MSRRISILMPVMNGSEFLFDSVPSVQAQTIDNWELLIGINNISRRSAIYERIRSFEDRKVRIFDLGEASGADEARLRLLEMAAGEFICPLDVDDTWHPKKLARQIGLMSEWDVVGTWCSYFGDRNDHPSLPAGEIAPEAVLAENPIIHSSVMLSRRDAKWSSRTDGIGDYELWLRLAAHRRRMFNIPERLTQHRIHSASAYNTRSWDVKGLRETWIPRVRTSDHYLSIQNEDLVEYLYDRGLDIVRDNDTIVEVGVRNGRSLCYVGERAKRLGCRVQLIAVDSFAEAVGTNNLSHNDGKRLTEFQKNICSQGIDHMVSVVRDASHHAATRFSDGSVPIVVINCDKSTAVTSTLRAWIPKTRCGGILAIRGTPDVDISVDVYQFATDQGLHVHGGNSTFPYFQFEIAGRWGSLATVIPVNGRESTEIMHLEKDRSKHFPSDELREFIATDEPCVVLDVGAGAGGVSIQYSSLFPNANIYAFEPDPTEAAALHMAAMAQGVANIHIAPFGLSDHIGWKWTSLSRTWTPNTMHQAGNGVFPLEIKVPVETIFTFCQTRGLHTVDILHLKAPGYEVQVLQGANEYLSRIRAICVDTMGSHLEAVDRYLRERHFAWVTTQSDDSVKHSERRLYVRRAIRNLLVGALSGLQHGERRNNCRSTWMADIRRHPGMDAVFLLGSEVVASQRAGDELHLPCENAYETLPQRTRWFCKWAIENTDCEYVFKCDDDTCIAIDRLAAFDPRGRDYIGRDLGGWASGGAGYFLSRRAAQIVAEEMTAETGAEDCCVADVLRHHGITISDDKRLLPWPGSGTFPSATNATITAHAIGIPAFRDIHAALQRDVGFRIVMPTSNRHAHVASTSLELLDRYWPDHPPVDVIHHEVAVPSAKAARQFYAGPQGEVSWCDAFSSYLAEVNQAEFLMILLDDYALCGKVQTARISQALQIMKSDPRVAAFYLTWIQLPSARQYNGCDGVIICPHWDYTVHLQAGLWRRSTLVRILGQLRGASCESFEITGSDIQNQLSTPELHLAFDLPPPAHPSLFLDSTEKTHWPMPYHNLMHRGQPDARHFDFLEKQQLMSIIPSGIH